MSDDYKKPDSWAMPDELAKRVSETLNNKRTTPEDALADALEEMARDIALIEPDPQDWGGWIELLVEKMVEEAKKRRKSAEFDQMMILPKINLQNNINS